MCFKRYLALTKVARVFKANLHKKQQQQEHEHKYAHNT